MGWSMMADSVTSSSSIPAETWCSFSNSWTSPVKESSSKLRADILTATGILKPASAQAFAWASAASIYSVPLNTSIGWKWAGGRMRLTERAAALPITTRSGSGPGPTGCRLSTYLYRQVKSGGLIGRTVGKCTSRTVVPLSPMEGRRSEFSATRVAERARSRGAPHAADR